MELEYWASTDIGRKRAHNEDNYLIDKDLQLFVVADGMGGHASGEIASAMAVHTIRDVLINERDLLERSDSSSQSIHLEICTLLEFAVHVACERIFVKATREPEKKGMGTTVVALLIVGNRGYIAHVGDSRIYLLRGGIVYQLTEDHSIMNELIRTGKIRAEDFDGSPYANFKNAMTRAVGPGEIVEVDTLDFDMLHGDNFLLCTDGLYDYLDEMEIAHSLALPEVADIPGSLLDLANRRGGKDNITAVTIRVRTNANGKNQLLETNLTLDTLKRIGLFKQLNYQQLVRVMNLCRILDIESDRVIFNEGDPAEEMFILVRGAVELSLEGNVLTSLHEGTHFGEMALIDDTRRSATAKAVRSTRLLSISRPDFFEILRKESPLAVKILWGLLGVVSHRLRSTTRDLGDARRQFDIDQIEALDVADVIEENETIAD